MAVEIEGPRYKRRVQRTYDHGDNNKRLQRMFQLEGEVGRSDAEAGGARGPSGHTSPAHGESEVKYANFLQHAPLLPSSILMMPWLWINLQLRSPPSQ